MMLSWRRAILPIQIILFLIGLISVLNIFNMTAIFPAFTSITNRDVLPKLESIHEPVQNNTINDTTSGIEYYRYKNVRLDKDILGSHNFLTNELQFLLHHQTLLPTSQKSQLIVGRFGASENYIMAYAELPPNTTKKIPMSDFRMPGYYFFNETTFEEQKKTVQYLGKLRIAAYGTPNIFSLFDWSHRPDQKETIMRYAPNSGHIHTFPLYPPCLTLHNDTITTPWTQMLENKTVLIVHPFIDTIKTNIPKLHDIWSNVNTIGAPNSCMPVPLQKFKFVRARLPVVSPSQPWLDSLEEMKKEIRDAGHFDIALLGCGGYGIPLLSYIASLNHRPSAMYIGGALQLYFGIHGGRWSVKDSNYYYNAWHTFYNDAWMWPLDSDMSFSIVGLVDDGSYVKPGQATGKH